MADSAPDSAPRPAFDGHRTPRADLVADCVHCGFCLPACPTYVLWGEEMDSPRGRIHLIAQGLSGEPLSESMVQHVDRCLGCLGCVTACPSGVRYDLLLEDTRAQVERRHRRPWRQRALRGALYRLFPYPRRLRLLRGPLRAYQGLGLRRFGDRLAARSPTLGTLAALTPHLSPAERPPARLPAQGAHAGRPRAVVGLLTGCVQDAFFPQVNAATARVLAAEGCDVVVPRGQGCCGALSGHGGREEEAKRFARGLIDAFAAAGVDRVVINSAGCGSAVKEYGRLLADDRAYAGRAAAFAAAARDVSELLGELVAERGPTAPRHPLPVTVAYHDACHLSHGQRIRVQPRDLLRGIPGLELREVPDGELCCGSAGVWNVLHPQPAAELGERKARAVLGTGADLLVTANPGCLMQIASAARRLGGPPLALAHTVQVLDASIRGVPVTRGGDGGGHADGALQL
jgi:glycolate oxidase iron-sulfur subunit